VTLALLALLLAVPAEKRLSLHAGDHRIEKLDFAVEAVEAEGPLRAELLPSGNELLLEPSGPGIARAFLFTRHEVRVIEIAVDAGFPAAAPPPTCPVVKDAACYAQFRASPQPRMVFELEGLQAEARAAQRELDRAGLRHVSIGISPYGVKLTGARGEAEKRKALRAIWPAILGPLRLD
jgi:hypothetical protein